MAIRLRSDHAEAHCNLANVLVRTGRFQEAVGYARRGHELGSRRRGWRYPSGRWLKEKEEMAEMAGKLPAVLKGEAEPP